MERTETHSTTPVVDYYMPFQEIFIRITKTEVTLPVDRTTEDSKEGRVVTKTTGCAEISRLTGAQRGIVGDGTPLDRFKTCTLSRDGEGRRVRVSPTVRPGYDSPQGNFVLLWVCPILSLFRFTSSGSESFPVKIIV